MFYQLAQTLAGGSDFLAGIVFSYLLFASYKVIDIFFFYFFRKWSHTQIENEQLYNEISKLTEIINLPISCHHEK